jgi:ABC-type glycerol-3-phosphate transport system substrate-binding protein
LTSPGTPPTTCPTRRQATRAGVALGVTATLAAACAPGAGRTPLPADAARPVKLVYMSPHVAGTDGMARDEALFGAFSRDYPNISVELSPPANRWPLVKEKLIVLAAAGTPNHLTQNGWGLWMDLARGGVIRELGSYFKADKLNPEGIFTPGAFNQHSYDGTLYGLPISVSADTFAYNKDIFDRSGLAYPPADTADRSWTMAALLEVAQRLTTAGEQAGMANTHSSGYPFNRGTFYGQLPWDEAKRLPSVNTPDFIKGIQFWVDIVYRYRAVPSGAEAQALASGQGNAFLAGRAGLLYTPTPASLRDVPFRWGLATLPYSGPAGSKNISGRAETHSFLLSKGIASEEADAAWTLFRWLMGKPENGGLVPATNNHIVAPYRDARYSELAMKGFEQLTGGVSARAALLTAQQAPNTGCGLLKYEEYAEMWAPLQEAWTKTDTNQMPARDFVVLAHKALEDAKLGSRGL